MGSANCGVTDHVYVHEGRCVELKQNIQLIAAHV